MAALTASKLHVAAAGSTDTAVCKERQGTAIRKQQQGSERADKHQGAPHQALATTVAQLADLLQHAGATGAIAADDAAWAMAYLASLGTWTLGVR